MQETLNLVNVPKLDVSRLSSLGDFHRKVDRIKRAWDINLEFNENARWRPGSYERLKKQVIHALFPHWEKPKGANTIKKLTKNHSYDVQQLRKDLLLIDDELRRFRANKETLDPEDAKKEGQLMFDSYMKELLNPINGVTVDISPLPYFKRYRRRLYSNEIWEEDWDKPIHPIIDVSGTIRAYDGYSKPSLEERLKVYRLNNNPKRWFVNIIIPIHNFEIEYKKSADETETLTQTPFGDLVVCFSMPIYDVIMNYRILAKAPKGMAMYNLVHKFDIEQYTNHTIQFPYISSIKHPFVKSSSRRYSYDIGNTCFGDFKDDIICALTSGMMGHLKYLLNEWSKTYFIRGTSPLNGTQFHHLGLPKDWDEYLSGNIATSSERCREAVRDGNFDEQYLIDNYCDNCQLSERADNNICAYYRQITAKPIDVPQEILEGIDILCIEDDGLPGKPKNMKSEEASLIIQATCAKLFQEIALRTQHTSDKLSSVLSFMRVPEMGVGNVNLGLYNENVRYLCDEIMAPEEEMNYDVMASKLYSIYRHSERIYWEFYAGEGLSEPNYEDLINRTYTTIEDAESKLPIGDFKMMVNTHRISTNQPPCGEYLEFLKHEYYKKGDANNGPF